jgi:hypothetical protein
MTIQRIKIAPKPEAKACPACPAFQKAIPKATRPMIHQGRKNCRMRDMIRMRRNSIVG